MTGAHDIKINRKTSAQFEIKIRMYVQRITMYEKAALC